MIHESILRGLWVNIIRELIDGGRRTRLREKSKLCHWQYLCRIRYRVRRLIDSQGLRQFDTTNVVRNYYRAVLLDFL